tara:strand:- start:48 stop:482 length:435 start_codon:yes stop_codon:yes gene_type:complete
MILSKNFRLEEFVDPETFEKYKDRCINFFDPLIFPLAQKLRDRYGSFVINDWKFGGERVWSGLRIPRSSYYSITSQHTRGGAIDCWFGSEESNKEVRQDVIKNRNDLFPEIGGIEVDISWCHFDTRFRKNGRLLAFSPVEKGNI